MNTVQSILWGVCFLTTTVIVLADKIQIEEQRKIEIEEQYGGEPCQYICSSDGGCTTRYAGPPRSGSTSGSCFPASFGGSCFGIPSGCRDCNKVKTCKHSPGGTGSNDTIKFKDGKTSPKCGTVTLNKVSKALKKELLALHNRLRRKIANGQEAGQPEASNMHELKWNKKLALTAQTWTNQCDCVFQDRTVFPCFHGGGSPVPGRRAGQNIAWTKYGGGNDDWTRLSKGWYDEVVYFNSSQVDSFTGSSGGRLIGHFTQFVWADTYQLGCGVIRSKLPNYGFHYIACDYYPAGNVMNQSVYQRGNPCSQCPSGTRCRNGLCKRRKMIKK